VVYDVLAESIKLIERRDVGGPTRLSRRRRFIPVGVDVGGDFAVTVFLRRSVGGAELEMHTLHRRHGTWRVLGGGGGSADFGELAQPVTRAELGSFGAVTAGAGTYLDGGSRWRPRPTSIQSAWLRLAVEVAAVEFDGRIIPVPWHHHVVVVWTGDAPHPAALLADDGAILARLDVNDCFLRPR
jgi:hypothetical protein